MMNKELKEVLSIYRRAGHSVYWYARLHWIIFPFQIIDTYIASDAHILDIGCGYGILDNYLLLKSDNRSVVGVDISERRIRIARSSAKGRTNLRFVCSDIHAFPFEKYTSIIIINFLHHISYEMQITLLRKCYEHLDVDGKLIVKEVGKEPKVKYWLSYLLGEKIIYPFDKIYYWHIEDFMSVLEKIGFRVSVHPMYRRNLFSHYLFECKKPMRIGA